MKNTIKCPTCGENIDVNEILYHQLESEFKQKNLLEKKRFEEEIAQKRVEYKNAIDELNKKEQNIKDKERNFELQVKEATQNALNQEKVKLHEELKKQILQEQNESMELLKKELKEKSNQVIELNTAKANIEKLKREKEEIEASILYAQNIQKAVLPSKEFRMEILPEHFVFFRPRNIVSGDFFWIKKIDEYIVVSVADCTGHGVPGAFMSMLGFMFLNEIVTVENIHNAGIILDKVREKVKESLHQSGREGETKDGMDMSFYIINSKNYEINYSGAFNPLYIIRENTEIDDIDKLIKDGMKVFKSKKEDVGASLIEIKADRQPIAIYSYEKAFTNRTFQLKKGDRLYSFSDGYPDQFGGEEGKKFNAKRFKEMLLEIRNNDMKTQKKLITDNFLNWMGTTEQVDDVILMGLKI